MKMKAITGIACPIILAIGINAAATTTHEHSERYYADAVEELEHEIGSGIHGASEDDTKANRRHHHHHQHNRRAASHQQQNSEELKGYKKKIDKRKAERERLAREDIQKLNDRLQAYQDDDPSHHHDTLRDQFHKRQQDKKIHLEKMHKEVTDALEGHHSGRRLLSEEELEHHTRRKGVLERKKRSMEEETPEKVCIIYAKYESECVYELHCHVFVLHHCIVVCIYCIFASLP